MMGNAVHEILHVLGMMQSTMHLYIDPTTGLELVDRDTP